MLILDYKLFLYLCYTICKRTQIENHTYKFAHFNEEKPMTHINPNFIQALSDSDKQKVTHACNAVSTNSHLSANDARHACDQLKRVNSNINDNNFIAVWIKLAIKALDFNGQEAKILCDVFQSRQNLNNFSQPACYCSGDENRAENQLSI